MKNHGKILILEDDRLYCETLEDFLQEEGFETAAFFDPLSAMDRLYEERFDLCLFDINLPFQNGLETLRQLREAGDRTPIVFLTSREDKESLLRGFELTAVDYLRKPVDLEELAARIAAAIRRERGEERRQIGAYTLDLRSRDLLDGETPLKIGRKIYDLLELFLQHEGRIVSHDMIRERLWPHGEEASEGAIRVYITRLKKLFPGAVENVRGVGYRFRMTHASESRKAHA